LGGKDARGYYCYSLYYNEFPGNLELFKKGYREVWGENIPEGELEKVLKFRK